VLALVSHRLSKVTEPWCVGASGALALHGFPLTPRDIDLFTTPHGVDQIVEALADYPAEPPRWWDSEHARSRFAALVVDGICVEVIGDLRPRCPDGQLAAHPRSLDCEWLVLPGTELRVPVSPLPVLVDSYRQAQRLERLRQIRTFLAEETR
jgi:hypothetical protein